MTTTNFPEDKFYRNDVPFEKWLLDFEEYVLAVYGDVANARKKAILMQMVGDEVKKYVDTLDTVVRADYAQLITNLKQRFKHQQNETIERHIFNNMNQHDNESIDSFVIRLKEQAAKCNYNVESITRSIANPNDANQVIEVPIEFSDITNDLIRDRIVCGVLNQAVRTRLLRDKELTLESAVAIVRAQELAEERTQALDGKQLQVNKLKRRKSSQSYNDKPESNSVRNTKNPQISNKKVRTHSNVVDCGFCGREHKPGKKFCPAYGKHCTVCNKKHHFSAMCQSKMNVNHIAEDNTQNTSDSDSDSGDDSFYTNPALSLGTLSVGTLSVDSILSRKFRSWCESSTLNGKTVMCKVDTGAECNVMSEKSFREICPDGKLAPPQHILKACGGTKLPVLGVANINCFVNEIESIDKFFIIAKNDVNPILGLDLLIRHKLVNPKNSAFISEIKESFMSKDKISELKTKYDDVFDNTKLGRMSEYETSIRLSKNAVPSVHPVRKIPFTLKKAVENELDRMESLGAISKVDGPTEWVSSMVLTKKDDNTIRICLDPSNLNEFVMREHTRLPTPEETFSSIGRASVFSKLDLKCGYWQLPLDEQSSYLTTFNTPKGRYRYNVMPFGLNCANEMFQKKMTQAFEGCEGARIMFDDILIFANSVDEHNRCLEKILSRCRDVGIKLNVDKCQFYMSEVKYIGHIISKEGMKPDPDKISDITNMPTPRSKKDVQRLLGMITYLSKYIPNLSTITQPLRQLLHKRTEFIWTFEQNKAFDQIKQTLTSAPVLAFYDVNKEVELHCDASSEGLGVCLLQDGKPVAYGSKSLTVVEERYATIEKELYAVLYGLERFNQFVYGKHVKVYTDHKPLVPLHKRPIHSTPARIQRMLLRTQMYDFTLMYKPGKSHYIPDTLSRACVKNSYDKDLQKELEMNMELVINSIGCTDSVKGKIREETINDPCLSKVYQYCENSWPENKRDCDFNVLPYWNVRHELSIFDNMIIYNNRIVIPKVLQSMILDDIHKGHQGIVRSKALARQTVYWANMNKDIEQKIESCVECLNTRKFPDKVSLMPHDIPSRPFEKIGIDILTVNGVKYQILICYFSKWVEVCRFNRPPTSKLVINHLRNVFSHFGIPECCFSDRERIYKSREIDEFCKNLGIDKKFSSSMYAQSNGQVERCVGHVKNLLKRCNYDFDELQMCLLDYHNTPLDSKTPSPFQILMNRTVKGRLPCLTRNLVTDNDIETRKSLTKRQNRSIEYYNRNASKNSAKVFKPGDLVVYRNDLSDRVWKRARVVHADPDLRSYTLINTLGNLIVRNVKMLLRDSTGRDFTISPEVNAGEPVSVSKGGELVPGGVASGCSPSEAQVAAPSATLTPVPEVVPASCPVVPMTTRPSPTVPRRSARIAAKIAGGKKL